MIKLYTLGLLTEVDTPLGMSLPETFIIAAFGTVFRPNRTGAVNRPNRTGAVNRPNRKGSVFSDRQGD
jgi:hypothetical protein